MGSTGSNTGFHTSIEVKTLDELHYEVLRRLLANHNLNDKRRFHEYKIQKGSFEGTNSRIEFNSLSLVVEFPQERPLAPSISNPSVTPPATDEMIEKYFHEYILGTDVSKNETYTYGSFIGPEVDRIAAMIKVRPHTNHAYIDIGGLIWTWVDNGTNTLDVDKSDHPPCLRHLQWRVIDSIQHLFCHFRSWDLWAGMPVNLGGLQLLNEYVAEMTGYKTGKLIAYSEGAHIYDYQLEMVKARLGK
jgi:thymidylate synthase